jgi:iron-sulfur cluster insertion protein
MLPTLPMEIVEMITLTEKAIAKVKEIGEAEGIGHLTIRVSVKGGGCSGMTHDMEFSDQVSDLDEIIEIDGIKIVVDPLSFQYLENASIDYLDSPFGGGGFKFSSPDIKSTCGCGSSVSY